MQFQSYIQGDDLRVHVIGEAVHSVRIQSDCDDYQHAADNGGAIKASEIALAPADALRAIVRQMAPCGRD